MKIPSRTKQPFLGFSLIETIISVAIIGLLLALLMPAVQSVREATRRSLCQSRLRDLTLGTLSFESSNGRLPKSGIQDFYTAASTEQFAKDHSFLIELLPYLEQGSKTTGASFASTVRVDKGGNVAINALLCASSPGAKELGFSSQYLGGPADRDLWTCDYSGNGGSYLDQQGQYLRGPLGLKLGSSRDITRYSDVLDGLSQTILVWESASAVLFDYGRRSLGDPNHFAPSGFYVSDGPGRDLVAERIADSKTLLYSWTGFRIGGVLAVDSNGRVIPPTGHQPRGLLNDNNITGAPFSWHPQLVNVAFADGHVRAFADSTDASLFSAMVSMNATEPIALE